MAPRGREEYAATRSTGSSAVAVVVLLNLWRANLLDDREGLTALMVLVIVIRFALWFAARQINKASAAAAAKA